MQTQCLEHLVRNTANMKFKIHLPCVKTFCPLRGLAGRNTCVCICVLSGHGFRIGSCVPFSFKNSSQYQSMMPRLSEHDRAGQRPILADATHGPHSRTHTAAPSWADSALRSRKHQETAPRVNVQLFVFLRRDSTVALLGGNANPLLTTRFTVF